jgi:hypothetical protein
MLQYLGEKPFGQYGAEEEGLDRCMGEGLSAV